MERRGEYTKAIEHERDPMARLASEILIQAIKDWRYLVKRKAWKSTTLQTKETNLKELRLFFKGDWCALLMDGFETDPAQIMLQLEAELQAAKDKERNVRK